MRSLSFQRTIGAGAFGTVYLAELQSGQGFRRPVAVKVLHRGAATDNPMFLSRIRDEARLLGLLQDDSILKVLDMVVVEGLDAVLMEYVDGVDLESLCEGNNPPPPRALAELGSAVAGALGRAHVARHPSTGQALNVIHRDVKPANIMVTSQGGTKLLDFGVARARFDARESQTGQLVLGTLNYMAPEYIVTGEVSPAADVFGLALCLWHAITSETYGQPKVRQDAHEKRLRERLAQIPAGYGALGPILGQMLAWSPGHRPSAAEAEATLQEAADRLGGPSLRTWARTAVAAAQRAREGTEDKLGFVGRTLVLSGQGPDEPPVARSETRGEVPPTNTPRTEARAPSPSRESEPAWAGFRQKPPGEAPRVPAEPARSPTPPPRQPAAPPPVPTPPSRAPAAPEIPAAPTPETRSPAVAPAQAAPTNGAPVPVEPLWPLIMKGLIGGALFGFFLLAIVAAVLLLG
jgi:serine/threonine protein kinase